MPKTLHIQDLTIQNPAGVLCRGLTFSVHCGEIVTLMGPSGSGKSTILSFILGALSRGFSAKGTVRMGNRDLAEEPIEKRGIAILFQDDLLFPHMSVAENLMFALPPGSRQAREKAVRKALAEMDLAGFEERSTTALSGGQKARISLMRALLSRPQAILLDEPFSKLDKPLRRSFRRLVFAKIREMGIPAVLVTHDEADAPEGGKKIFLDSEIA